MGTDSLYVVGACATEGLTDKEVNGDRWRFLYPTVPLIYQISNYPELGKEMSMFAPSTSTPQLVILGQDSKIAFSHQGLLTEDTIRVEIRKALNGFGNLQQVKKTG
ncbi:MAG: hypothetical protein KAS62_03405, partial [Candidatus Delongbacteria bacterium]|nr:hypothetical protein [Candidatus Delongbacteria bacterium]